MAYESGAEGGTWDFEPGTLEYSLMHTFMEHGPVESTQFVLWIVCALLAFDLAVRRTRPRERLFSAWLCFGSAIAAMREMDMHIFLNPEYLGDWGVRYRLDWWISAEAPILPRLMWAAIGAAFVFAMLWPLLRTAPRMLTLLRAGDRAFRAFVIAVCAFAVGYACDDLFGRGMFVPDVYSQALEETAELVGVAFVLLGMTDLHARSLTTRERRAQEWIDRNKDDAARDDTRA